MWMLLVRTPTFVNLASFLCHPNVYMGADRPPDCVES